MHRRISTKAFFITVAVVVTANALLLMLDRDGRWQWVGLMIDFPAVPLLLCLSPLLPVPMGEPEMTPTDYVAIAVLVGGAALFWGVAVGFITKKLLERSAAQIGICPVCGYDLRASPERCPECGAASPTPSKSTLAP